MMIKVITMPTVCQKLLPKGAAICPKACPKPSISAWASTEPVREPAAYLEDPANDDRITNRQSQRSDHGKIADRLSDLGIFSAACYGLAKGSDGAGTGGPPECHFTDDAGKTNDDYKKKIGRKKVPLRTLRPWVGTSRYCPCLLQSRCRPGRTPSWTSRNPDGLYLSDSQKTPVAP